MPHQHDDTAVFPMLARPDSYRACLWNLSENAKLLPYWLKLFRRHFPTLLNQARLEAADRGVNVDIACAQAEDVFFSTLDHMTDNATTMSSLTILDICWEREHVLRDVGIADPYRLAKQKANASALKLLPALLKRIDDMPQDQRMIALLKGVFAGNIYDLGATKTEALFRDGDVDFDKVLGELKPRPWFRDNADALLAKLEASPYRAACLFVDNAGADIVLGMLPFARELLGRSTRVILAANSEPSLNDVTYSELVDLVELVSQNDPPLRAALDDGRLTIVPSGNWAPLIDLSKVSPRLVEAVEREQVDFVMLEGMGRGIESNYDVQLTVDVLNAAMIKDEGVADGLGFEAKIYDLVCRFEPGIESS